RVETVQGEWIHALETWEAPLCLTPLVVRVSANAGSGVAYVDQVVVDTFCGEKPKSTTIDGHLDVDYGSARSVQTTATSFGDAPPGFHPPDSLTRSQGSELDQGFGCVADGMLYLFIAGNIKTSVTEPLTPA